MSSHLCANSGKWFTNEDGACDLDFIKTNETGLVAHSNRHAPVSSAIVLGKFRDKAKELGITLTNEKGALYRKGGTRYIYTADVVDAAHPDYALSVGFRNFNDCTLSFSGMCGTSVFVCENGMCSSIVKPSRLRHTIGNMGGNFGILDTKIDKIFERFIEDSPKIAEQIDLMKGTRLTDEIVGKFVRQIINKPLWGACSLGRVLKDLDNPELNSHEDSSCFRLLNSCTKVTTHDFKNPNSAALASREANNLIMSIIKSDFIPLGDDVEIEAVEAEVLD